MTIPERIAEARKLANLVGLLDSHESELVRLLADVAEAAEELMPHINKSTTWDYWVRADALKAALAALGGK